MMSLDMITIVQKGLGEWRVHNFAEGGNVMGDVPDQEKDVDEEHGHLLPRQEVAVGGGQKDRKNAKQLST